ncbi:MAG: hypothetical protein JNK82_32855 [Myxococcaceae bacterium]|nr:hypothetical protein [Myxococcaceae bacterium]
MADVIDLTLVADARRYLTKMLDARGLNYFLRTDARRPFQLEPTKVEMVVRTAARSRARERRPHHRAVDFARKEVRRELIKRVVAEMLGAGL